MGFENRRIFRVSQINKEISQTLENQFPSLWLKGELSNFISHNSGHWYFSLKEEEAQIRGVMFRGSNKRLSFAPENGQEILVRGRISVYAPRGTYQIICEEMELAGAGVLQKQFEELKKKLDKEGLFDSKHKKALPSFPKHIAVITSPTGAAIRDILQVLQRRFKAVKVTLIPALVQGGGAAKNLVSALGQAELLQDVDTLIIGRGGGSLEDLWAFNDESLARAIHHCSIPIISAVGHEIDFTICDFVSDLRAPTPSAAAELVVQNREEILKQIQKWEKQLSSSLRFHLHFWREKLSSLEKQLQNPKRVVEELIQRVDELGRQLHLFLKQKLEVEKTQLENLKKLLKSFNPRDIMERGFCIARNKEGKILTQSKNLKLKEVLSVEFFKGQARLSVVEKK